MPGEGSFRNTRLICLHFFRAGIACGIEPVCTRDVVYSGLEPNTK